MDWSRSPSSTVKRSFIRKARVAPIAATASRQLEPRSFSSTARFGRLRNLSRTRQYVASRCRQGHRRFLETIARWRTRSRRQFPLTCNSSSATGRATAHQESTSRSKSFPRSLKHCCSKAATAVDGIIKILTDTLRGSRPRLRAEWLMDYMFPVTLPRLQRTALAPRALAVRALRAWG